MNSSSPHKTTSCRLFLTLLFISVTFFSPLDAVAATHDVTVGNNSFSPNDLTIEVGDTVRWTNSSGRSHDVTADDGSFAGPTSNNFVYSRTFTNIGEVLYYCSVHSSPGQNRNTSMNGRINVIAATISTDVSVELVDAVDGAYEAGEDFRVQATLKNNGAESSGMFNVNFYASVDNVITVGDTLLTTKNITNINAGESENLDESVDLPASMAKGDYFVGAIIDLDDSDLTNNTAVDEVSIYVFVEFTMNAGLNDAWFDPVKDGQGFFITIFPDLGVVSLAWFTYDTVLPPMEATANLGDPGHRWLTGAGTIIGDEAVINIVVTSGGIFDDPAVVDRTDPPGSDGTFTLKFKNCNSGTLDYDITSISAVGTVPIQRVALDNVKLCEALLREFQQD